MCFNIGKQANFGYMNKVSRFDMFPTHLHKMVCWTDMFVVVIE